MCVCVWGEDASRCASPSRRQNNVYESVYYRVTFSTRQKSNLRMKDSVQRNAYNPRCMHARCIDGNSIRRGTNAWGCCIKRITKIAWCLLTDQDTSFMNRKLMHAWNEFFNYETRLVYVIESLILYIHTLRRYLVSIDSTPAVTYLKRKKVYN